MNKVVVNKVIGELIKNGVKDFCVCAGSRNSSLVATLHHLGEQINLYRFFEERSAAFFALGKMMAQPQNPVAVVVTSGTAAAELLPATIEAHYQAKPLVLVTADRPKSYRQSGAPQAIEQVGLYSHYIEKVFDLDEENFKDFQLESCTFLRPIQVNCCLEDEDYVVPDYRISTDSNARTWSIPKGTAAHEKTLKKFISSAKNLVVLLGTLHPAEAEVYLPLLEKLNAPIWAEASSNLISKLSHKTVFSNEDFLQKNSWTEVLRLGGVPSCRFWRDLEKRKEVKVLSLANFKGLSRPSEMIPPAIYELEDKFQNGFALNLETAEKWRVTLDQFPLSEVTQVHRLSQAIESNAVVFLGNSLSIREWNKYAEIKDDQIYFAARGANGIDGQVSTALGLADAYSNRPLWIVVGDLTALYDLSAPWLMSQLKNQNIKIAVINNEGGEIFSRLKQYKEAPESFRKLMKNEHHYGFRAWAEMWSLPYTDSLADLTMLNHSIVLELKCSPLETQAHLAHT